MTTIERIRQSPPASVVARNEVAQQQKTSDNLIQQLVNSRLITSEKLREVVTAVEQRGVATARAVLAKLCRRGFVTEWQLGELREGRATFLIDHDRYLLLRKIGQGGMGAVYAARHMRLNRVVALKMVDPERSHDEYLVERFRREIDACSRLQHPNIVHADDVGEHEGAFFLVLEYVDGSDLSAVVKRHGPLPIDRAIACIRQAAQGLAYAHARGVVHRDIKPSNLLVDREGVVKILDMGLARLDSTLGDCEQAELTRTGAIMGTVDFMSPEQALDTKRADARSDVYSLGATFWFLLTGKALYEGGTLMQKVLAHRDQEIPSLAAARLDVSAGLDSIFRRMVAKQPEDRFQSTDELLAALQGEADGSGAPGRADDSQLRELFRGLDDDVMIRPIGMSAASAGNGNGKAATMDSLIEIARRPDGIAAIVVVAIVIVAGALMFAQNRSGGTGDGTKVGRNKVVAASSGDPAKSIASSAPKAARADPEPIPQPSQWPDDAAVFSSKRFKLSAEQLDWNGARRRCLEMGGRLAEPRSREENLFLLNLCVSSGVDGIWLSANDIAKEGNWRWDDGSPVEYANWDVNQPNDFGPGGEDYAMLLITQSPGKWWDQPAASGRGLKPGWKVGFVCEWDSSE